MSNIITFMALWQTNPIYALFLFLDSVVYSLLAYTYKLFTIMSQLNFNAISAIAEPLVSRVKAVVIVFILFKLGVSFLQYMVKPEEFENQTKGGKALLINILIAIAFLGISDFFFAFTNELSLTITGYNGNPNFQILKSTDGDQGLLTRLIFGNSDNEDVLNNYGNYLAVSTLNLFLHTNEQIGYNSEVDRIYDNILNADGSFSDIVNVNGLVGIEVEYKWPIVSTALGLYLIYSIAKIAIEVGIRAFKLIILQLIAPISIISIVTEGIGGTFTKYIKKYFEVFIDVFIRIATMLVISGIIANIYNLLMNEESAIFGGVGNIDGTTKLLLMAAIVIAGYKFAEAIPNFINSIFNINLPDEKGEFGSFLKKTAGAIGVVGGTVAGGVAGAIAGGVAAKAEGLGFGTGAANVLSGIVSGGKSRKISQAVSNSYGRASEFKANGGALNTAWNRLGGSLGINQAKTSRMQLQNDRLEKAQRNAAEQVRKNGATFSIGGKNYNFSGVSSASELAERAKSSSSEYQTLKADLLSADERSRKAGLAYSHASSDVIIANDNYDKALAAYNSVDASTDDSVEYNNLVAAKEAQEQANEALAKAQAERDEANRSYVEKNASLSELSNKIEHDSITAYDTAIDQSDAIANGGFSGDELTTAGRKEIMNRNAKEMKRLQGGAKK